MYLEPPFDPCEEAGTERESALAEQLGAFVRAASGAFSSNTERALKSDLAIFSEWCAGHGMRALPARPETVAAFVDAVADIQGREDAEGCREGGYRVMKLQRQPTAPGEASGRLGVEFSRLLCDDGHSASCRGGSKKTRESCGVDGRTAIGLDAGSRIEARV